MRAPTAKEMYRRSQLSQLVSLGPLPNWNSSDDEDESHTPHPDQNGVLKDAGQILGGVADGAHTIVNGVLSTVESVVSEVVDKITSPILTGSIPFSTPSLPSISLPFDTLPTLPLPITTIVSLPTSPSPLPTPTRGSGDTSSDAPPSPTPEPTTEPTTSDTFLDTSIATEPVISRSDTETLSLSESTRQFIMTKPASTSNLLNSLALSENHLMIYTKSGNPNSVIRNDGSEPTLGGRPDGWGASSTRSPGFPPDPTGPPRSPGNPSPRTISITFSTLFIVLVAGVAGLLWWRKRQNTQGVNMFGRRLEFGETPGAWSQIESGEGTGYGAVEKKGKAKEVSRNETDVGYGTIQRGGMLHNTSASAGERRRRKLPVITPILSWVKARSRSKAHRAEEHGANSGTLPRARNARQRQSLSPVSLPSSSNTSLRSGSFISSDENDVSIYMHVMQDDDSLTPSPSPRSLSMSMTSRLSRISGSTDDLSEFEASPGRGRSRKRRDSQSSSSSEETSDTRSSFGFVRPVVATTGGATPSVFTATGHYITNNASTTTLASPPPRTSTPPETTSNQGSPYGPGLDFFSARAWRKPQTAGPSLMEVVNSWSAPPSPGGVEQGYRSMSGGSSRPS